MIYLNSKFFSVVTTAIIVSRIGQPDQRADTLSTRDLDLLFDMWCHSFVVTCGVAARDRLHRPTRIHQQVAARVI